MSYRRECFGTSHLVATSFSSSPLAQMPPRAPPAADAAGAAAPELPVLSSKDFFASFSDPSLRYSGPPTNSEVDLNRWAYRVRSLLSTDGPGNSPTSCLDLAVTALSDAAFDAATAIAPGLRAAVDPAGAQLHLFERLVEELKLVFLPANRVLLAVDALLTTSQGRRDYDTYVADFSRLASRVADLPAHMLIMLFLNGLHDKNARMQVLASNPQTLEAARSLARVYVRQAPAAIAVAATPARPTPTPAPLMPAQSRSSAADISRLRRADGIPGAVVSERIRLRQCIWCGSTGHMRRDCPDRLARRPPTLPGNALPLVAEALV